MKSRWIVFLSCLCMAACAAAPSDAWASKPPGGGQVSSGSVEFSPKVSFSHSNMKREGYGNLDTFTELDLNPTLGFCVTEHWEVTGGMLVRHSQANDMKETNLGATAGAIYNFSPKGSIIPFVGAGFGVLFNGGFAFDNTAVLAPDLTGGVRVLVGNAASVNMSLGYRHETDGHVHVNRMAAQVGVSLFPWNTR